MRDADSPIRPQRARARLAGLLAALAIALPGMDAARAVELSPAIADIYSKVSV